ncbi:asialoglycoprotein receptor 2-like [Leuresthes tenuis]|uniref:asialoglycoprotein receptor 2-like n=1 Tax=Leuresthes tenuis TaxID=355514 RepID=UPI003B50B192
MEEELNYVSVTFNSNGISLRENTTNSEVIYDEVKTGEKACPVVTENQKAARLCSPLTLAMALLGSTCLILVSAITAVSFHFLYELRRQNMALTEQNLRLWTEKAALKKQTEDLTRDRDQLSWTIGVIMEYDNFPVKELCPQKECKPCLDGWLLFQSSCYLFTDDESSWRWKNWETSRDRCKEKNADLVVIGSQEEQEFISNHTKNYDAKNGYWIGLSKNTNDVWMWVDGSDVTEMYWVKESDPSRLSCAISNPSERPLANWDKVSCSMKNQWICETRALIRSDSEPVTGSNSTV